MKGIFKGRRILSVILSLAMVISVAQLSILAALGELSNVDTGLTGNIDTGDTISLPIRILDYEADGMLFEYAESKDVLTAEDFGASAYRDYASLDALPGNSDYYGDYWGSTSISINTTNEYASFVRFSFANSASSLSSVATTWSGDKRAGVIIPNNLAKVAINDARYLVLVYRSNVTDGSIEFFLERTGKDRYTSSNSAGNFAFVSEGNTIWTYAVYDLKSGNIASDWNGTLTAIWTTLPIDASGEYIDIAHAALFADEDQAKAFGEYALTDGSDRGDNRGFGLLRSSRTENDGTNFGAIYTYDNTSADYGNAVDTITQLGWASDDISVFENATNLGYTLLGQFNGIANVGLLESSLSDDGSPVYKEEVVTYLAYLLKHSLEISERTSDGWKNYRYVKGTASDIYGGTDLATALRNRINGTMGSYEATSAKKLVGTWTDVEKNIASYYDAAYFLLNSIFFTGSYNELQDDYNYLVLSKGTDTESGNTVYVFDGGFTTSSTPDEAESAVEYDKDNKTISNSSAAGKTHFVYEVKTSGESTTTLYPFLPITDKNSVTDQTINTYYQDDGVINTVKEQSGKDTLYQRNYNFAIVSEGEFTYYADDELFFDFEGDDDVYLFINGELVMDIGSAHGIDHYRFNLNDYVEAAKAATLGGSVERNQKLALEDGNTYTFAFYYMERHSYGSNMRIETNIRVTDPSMTTEKTAYQNGTQVDFGSIVDKNNVVEYGFSITNSGLENLYNLTFSDPKIGFTMDPTNGLIANGARVFDVNKETLTVSDLTAVLSAPDAEDVTYTFSSDEELKQFLADPSGGHGLEPGATVTIRGIAYQLSDAEINAGVFDNTVFTTSTNNTGEKLQGQDTMRVFVPADPMYYQWAGHEIHVTRTKLIADVLEAAAQEDNVLNGKLPDMTANNVTSITVANANVTVGSSDLTIKFPNAGSHVFYATITYTANSTSKSVRVPVLVNVTAVKDSVYVLDYGLSVDLTAKGELFKNDTLSVPGRDTEYSLLAIGSNGSYSPNEITFTDAGTEVKGTYGTFTISGDTITYTPTAFMEGEDSVQVAVNVYESDATPSKIAGDLDINNEVEMYKTITVLPANVVYYEDDFPAISYPGSNTITTIGSSSDKTQSNNQDEQYGHDDTYEDTDADENSAGSLTTITIGAFETSASFTFKGTGFELISRTNAKDSASILLTVKDSTGATVKTIPVITEFDNNNDGGNEGIYQVPVIRVNDLTLGTYTVEISGVPAYDYDNVDANGEPTPITTYLYIDGLRIYQPLGDTNDNYLDTENGARFVELRDEIVAGKIAVVSYNETDGITVSTTTSTWTENLSGETSEGDLKFNQVDSVEDYLLQGPNNEVYMTGTYDNAALVFYVREDGTGAHSLQIALRGLDESLFFAGIENDAAPNVNAKVLVGVYDNGEYKWDTIVENCTSSTEQYYVIDYTKGYYDEAKSAYQIVVRVDSGMVSYSSLKLTGLELVSVEGESTDLRYVNGVLNKYITTTDDNGISTTSLVEADASAYVNFRSVSLQMASTTMLSDKEDNEPVVEPDTDPVEPDTDPVEPDTEPVEPDVEPERPDNKPVKPDKDETAKPAVKPFDPKAYLENLFKKIFKTLVKSFDKR